VGFRVVSPCSLVDGNNILKYCLHLTGRRRKPEDHSLNIDIKCRENASVDFEVNRQQQEHELAAITYGKYGRKLQL
jgi:hypothetical protein